MGEAMVRRCRGLLRAQPPALPPGMPQGRDGRKPVIRMRGEFPSANKCQTVKIPLDAILTDGLIEAAKLDLDRQRMGSSSKEIFQRKRALAIVEPPIFLVGTPVSVGESARETK